MNNYGVAYPAANQGDVATRLNVGWLRFFTLTNAANGQDTALGAFSSQPRGDAAMCRAKKVDYNRNDNGAGL